MRQDINEGGARGPGLIEPGREPPTGEEIAAMLALKEREKEAKKAEQTCERKVLKPKKARLKEEGRLAKNRSPDQGNLF